MGDYYDYRARGRGPPTHPPSANGNSKQEDATQRSTVSGGAGSSSRPDPQHHSAASLAGPAQPGAAPCRVCSDFRSWAKSGGTQKAGDTKSSTKQDECPLDREQLGRHTWNFLHTMAAYYPQHPSKVDQRRMESFLTSLGYFYPCDHCAEDFREEMKKSPPKVASRSELSRWLCDQHNVVNRKLGKKEFDCSKVFERWLTGPTDGSC